MTLSLAFATAQYAMALSDFRATFAGLPAQRMAAAPCRNAATGPTLELMERQLRCAA